MDAAVAITLNPVEFQSILAGTVLGPRRRRFPVDKTTTYPLLRGFHTQPRVPRGMLTNDDLTSDLLTEETAARLREAEEAVFIRGR